MTHHHFASRRAYVVVAPLLLAACDLTGVKGVATDDNVFVTVNNFSAVGSNCVGTSDYQDLDALDFGQYETYGSGSSSAPGSSSYVVTRHDSGPSATDSSCSPSETNQRNPVTGDNTATWSTWGETWYANGGEGTYFLLCNKNDGTHDCTNATNDVCSGTYKVTITNASSCSAYNGAKIWLDASTTSLMAQRRMDADADCSAGSGRFQLFPVQLGDRDGDGSYHYAFLPIQKTGTGVMTRSAWITSIDKVSAPTGVTLRVINSDQKFSFDYVDVLKDASNVSSVVNSTNTYSTGVIDGDAAFVVSEISPSNADDFVVDIGWSCGTGYTATNSLQGYQFRLSDIGCTGYNQKMTLRVGSSPNRVVLEEYGNTAVARTEPTATTSEGKAFAFDRGSLSIDGVVLSNNSQQAQVKLNYIRWDGTDICTAGTYTFAAE